MKHVVRCCITTLCPVHIGCDEVYEPAGFVLDEKQQKLVVFDPMRFFAEMGAHDRSKFAEICRRGTVSSILEIYNFLRNRPASGRAIALCSGFLDHYRKTLGMSTGDEKRIQQELNNFSISRTAFLAHDQRPYVPGSAIKGAMRTGYLNGLAKEKRVPAPRRGDGHELEKALLDGGSFDTDPFRMLKVSDFLPMGAVATRILYAVNEKKKLSENRPRGPSQILEVIPPNTAFGGTITLDDPEKGAKIRNPINFSTLWKNVNGFYSREKQQEDKELQGIGLNVPQLPESDPLALIRLGRHSGAESVTIEGFRDIRIMQGKDQKARFLPRATTLWLASNERLGSNKGALVPFGWAVLGELTPAIEETLRETEKSTLQDTSGPFPEGKERDTTPPPAPLPTVTWEHADVTWSPGDASVVAKFERKQARGRGKELVAEDFQKRLFKDKHAKARVIVIKENSEYFRIIRVERS